MVVLKKKKKKGIIVLIYYDPTNRYPDQEQSGDKFSYLLFHTFRRGDTWNSYVNIDSTSVRR